MMDSLSDLRIKPTNYVLICDNKQKLNGGNNAIKKCCVFNIIEATKISPNF